MSVLRDPIHDILLHYQAPHLPEPPSDLVSIIIASYNHQKFVESTLETVRSQTHQNLELVIVDDCSPDDSAAAITRWLAQYRERFARVVFAKPHQNQGLAQSRNSAIRFSCGRKIFVLDSDNELLPQCIERHASVMDRTGAELVYSVFEWFGAKTQPGYADIWDPERLK